MQSHMQPHSHMQSHTCANSVTHTVTHTDTHPLEMSVDSSMLVCRLRLAQDTSRLKYAEQSAGQAGLC